MSPISFTVREHRDCNTDAVTDCSARQEHGNLVVLSTYSFIHPKAKLHEYQSSLSPQDMSSKTESSFVSRCRNKKQLRHLSIAKWTSHETKLLPHTATCTVWGPMVRCPTQAAPQKAGVLQQQNMLPHEAESPRSSCHWLVGLRGGFPSWLQTVPSCCSHLAFLQVCTHVSSFYFS